MCGIGAIINGNPGKLERLMLPIVNRGETFNENIVLDDIALSCNRLKILDRENARQPSSNEDGTILAVLNGEIYNFFELKQELENEGHRFRTDADTEVIVHGYEEWGKELPTKLDGQFAIIVYDKKTGEFLAARDPYGIKPLHIAKQEKTLYLASELKQLIPFAHDIELVKPGTLVTAAGKQAYYKLPMNEVQNDLETAIQNIRCLLDESVRKRVQTDLPVAVFLSGGVDSTAVLATARKYHDDVTAIIVGYDWRSEDSDAHFAVKYCEENNIQYVLVEPPTEEELFGLVPDMVRITESFEPNMIKQSTLSYHIAKLAKEHGFKIALCGEGADEIFAGYPEFVDQTNETIRNLSYGFFENLYRTQLQRVDRTSMHHTLEVRVPLMDVDFVEYCINLAPDLKVKDGITKWVFREAVRDRLPGYIVDRKKVVLSEGMGHKGNSLTDGLFVELAAAQIPDGILAHYQEKYPHLNINTKEEALYLDIYQGLGYNKLISTDRPIVNKTHSTGN